MRTYPSFRRAVALLLAVVALVLGVFSLLDPNYSPQRNAFLLGMTDVLLAVSIILGVVIIRSQHDR